MVKLIADMITESKGIEKVLLKELQVLNYRAYTDVVRARGFTLKQKYAFLQKTPIWKEAKKLLYDFFTVKKDLQCPTCGKKVMWKGCVLHHIKPYNLREYFTPSKTKFTHYRCHSRIHKSEKRAKKKG